VSAPPALWIDVVGPRIHARSSCPFLRRSAGPLLLDPRVVREVASSSRGAPHSESLGLECVWFAADRPRRAALRVRTPGLACCVAGWWPPGGRARSESVLASCSMLAWPVSIELIALPFSHLSHVAVKHKRHIPNYLFPGPPRLGSQQSALACFRRVELQAAAHRTTVMARTDPNACAARRCEWRQKDPREPGMPSPWELHDLGAVTWAQSRLVMANGSLCLVTAQTDASHPTVT
jgi:hypothetical protein